MGNVDPLPGDRLGKAPAAVPGSGAERDLPRGVSALLRVTLDLLVEHEELGEAIRLLDEDPSHSFRDDSTLLLRFWNLGKEIEAVVTVLSKQRPLTIDDRTAYLEVIERAARFYTDSRDFIALIQAGHAEISTGGILTGRPPGSMAIGRLGSFFRRWRRGADRKQSE